MANKPDKKTPNGEEAFNPAGLVPRAVIELKKRFPDVGIVWPQLDAPWVLSARDAVAPTLARKEPDLLPRFDQTS